MRQVGPGICGSKYVEDVKVPRSVRGWDRVPMKSKTRAIRPLWGNIVALSLPLYRGSKRDL